MRSVILLVMQNNQSTTQRILSTLKYKTNTPLHSILALQNHAYMAFLSTRVKGNRDYFPNSYASVQSPIELCPPVWTQIPVIDLAKGNHSLSAARELVEEIKRTCQEFGMFKVANHGISDEIMTSVMRSVGEFYYSSPENSADHQSLTPQEMLYTSSVAHAQGSQNPRFWRDSLQLAWNTKEDAENWPIRPYNFGTNIWKFGEMVSTLEDRLVKLISEALKLDDAKYFDRGLRKDSYVLVNQFPPCSKPKETLGMPEHCDDGILMTTLLGDVPGTQIWVGGEWKQVAPCMNTLLVTVGNILQVVSNGKFKAPKHREVVNSERARTVISYLSQPAPDCMVGPAREILETNVARYGNFKYGDYLKFHLTDNTNTCTQLQRYERM